MRKRAAPSPAGFGGSSPRSNSSRVSFSASVSSSLPPLKVRGRALGLLAPRTSGERGLLPPLGDGVDDAARSAGLAAECATLGPHPMLLEREGAQLAPHHSTSLLL